MDIGRDLQKAYEEGYVLGKLEATTEQQKYKWHDLRKNPEDTPYKEYMIHGIVDGCRLGVAISDSLPMVVYLDKHEQMYTRASVDSSRFRDDKYHAENGNEIIAWKYIEPFEGV